MHTAESIKPEIQQFASSASGAPMTPAFCDHGALELFDGFDLELAATVLDIDALGCDGGGSCSDFTTDADDCASLLSHCSDSDVSSRSVLDGTATAPSSPAQLSMQTTRDHDHEPQQQQLQSPPPAISHDASTAPTTSKQVAIEQAPTTSTTTTTRTTAARPPPALKRPRKHNRIEILKLRDEVEELEARAAKLRKQANGPDGHTRSAQSTVAVQYALRYGPKALQPAHSSANEAPRSVWLDMAVEQYAALVQSQSVNCKLRAAIAKQLTAGSSLQELLTKQTSIQDAEVLGEISRAIYASEAEAHALDCSDLYESVEKQFLDSGLMSRVIEFTSDSSAAFHTSRMKYDAMRGPMFEVTTNMRVVCPVDALGRMIWRRIMENCDARWGSYSPHQLAHLSAVHERRVHVMFSTSLGDIHADGATVLKKFVVGQRVVIAVATKWHVRECGLVLRETSWIVALNATIDDSELETRSSSCSPVASLYQTFYRIWCEHADAASATGSSPFTVAQDERTQLIQEALTKSAGERMRDHIVGLQNAMANEMANAAARNVPFQVPTIKCPY